MVKKTLASLLFLALAADYSNGQNIEQLNHQIDSLNQELSSLQHQADQAEQRLDEAKLQRIHQQIMKYGLPTHPDTATIIHHKGYSLQYNPQHKQADWVVHIVTDDVQEYESARTDDYRADPALDDRAAEKGDYWYSGYDRGHLAPSADFRWDSTALSETYYYTNMAPMHPALNRESWAKLESYVREWAIQFGEVFVVTGGVLTRSLKSTGQHSRELSVPRYYYKVVVDRNDSPEKGIAFLLPNDTCHRSIYNYVVTIDSVERLTGLDFFPRLPDPQENRMERQYQLDEWKIQHTIPSTDPLSVKEGRLNTVEAQDHLGQKRTVCGTVVATKFSDDTKGKPTFLNLDRPFPDSPFSITIWGHNRKNFSYAPEERLIGKQICVTGTIKEYRGTPQIVLTHEKQLNILGEGGISK